MALKVSIIAEKQSLLNAPENATNYSLLEASTKEIATQQSALDELIREWESAHEELENLSL